MPRRRNPPGWSRIEATLNDQWNALVQQSQDNMDPITVAVSEELERKKEIETFINRLKKKKKKDISRGGAYKWLSKKNQPTPTRAGDLVIFEEDLPLRTKKYILKQRKRRGLQVKAELDSMAELKKLETERFKAKGINKQVKALEAKGIKVIHESPMESSEKIQSMLWRRTDFPKRGLVGQTLAEKMASRIGMKKGIAVSPAQIDYLLTRSGDVASKKLRGVNIAKGYKIIRQEQLAAGIKRKKPVTVTSGLSPMTKAKLAKTTVKLAKTTKFSSILGKLGKLAKKLGRGAGKASPGLVLLEIPQMKKQLDIMKIHRRETGKPFMTEDPEKWLEKYKETMRKQGRLG